MLLTCPSPAYDYDMICRKMTVDLETKTSFLHVNSVLTYLVVIKLYLHV